METEKRRAFLINFFYFIVLLALSFLILKYALPVLAPFVAALVICYFLKVPIRTLSQRTPLGKSFSAILVVLLFYSTIGLLLFLLGMKTFSATKGFVLNLPTIYYNHVEPSLMVAFQQIEKIASEMDLSLVSTLRDLFNNFTESFGQFVSNLSFRAMGAISGLASSLPGLFIKLLLTIISTFFIAADYDNLTEFFMRQLGRKSKSVFLQVKKYIVGTLLVCIRSYALIMAMTFAELFLGLSIIGIPNALLIALTISVFDILPVLGTGGIMIPWIVFTALQSNYPHAIGLLVLYLLITIIRNIVEPKIVGGQLGLHSVVTLASMYVGAQTLGLIGMLGFPILLSLLRHLNDTGTIHIFKSVQQKNHLSRKR